MATIYRGNVVTPLNTLGLTIDLNDINSLAHTMIIGNDDARPSRMLKAMIEHDLKNGRKVIAVGFNTSYAGLATGTITVVDLTRANATFQLNVSQADILAAMIVASPHSFAIDIGGEEPGPAAVVVERIAAHLSTQECLVAPTTLAIDLTDVLTPKRRMGLDADAVQQINSLIGRGFDLGARLLMAANAPSEVPLEFERGTMQTIVTRVTRNAIRSVGKHVDEEERLYRHADRPGIGLASIPLGDFWFFPMTDDAYGPYLVNVPKLETAVGDRDQSGRVITPATRAFCAEYLKKVAEVEAAKEAAEVERQVAIKLRKKRVDEQVEARISLVHPRRGSKAAGVKIGKTAPTVSGIERPGIKQVEDLLKVMDGINRPNCRARAIVTDAQLQDKPLTLVEAVAAAKSNEALRAAGFGERLYNAGMTSKGIASALGYRFIGENADKVDEFCVRLLNSDAADVVGAAGAWLRKTNVHKIPIDAERRIRTICKAWRDHLDQAVSMRADNDDAKIDRAA